MQITALALCELLQGTLEGNPDILINNVAKIEDGTPNALSFLANPKYEPFIYTTKSGVVLVSKEFKARQPIAATLIRVEDPYATFAFVLKKYQEIISKKEGVEQPSFVSEGVVLLEGIYLGAFSYVGLNVKLGKNVKIYPNCYIGDNCEIGDNTTVFAGVKIYAYCKVGQHCVLHSGAVIGADGFGFAPKPDGTYEKIPQTGNVVLENYVEIGANTTIDRASIGSTVVKEGAKIDNLVQIAHNVEIGNHSVIAGQSGVSGSTKIGKNCMIGGQVGLAGHLEIADGTKIGAQTGISKSIKKTNSQLFGTPALELHQSLKAQAVYRNLPELQSTLHFLEKKLIALETEIQNKANK